MTFTVVEFNDDSKVMSIPFVTNLVEENKVLKDRVEKLENLVKEALNPIANNCPEEDSGLNHLCPRCDDKNCFVQKALKLLK